MGDEPVFSNDTITWNEWYAEIEEHDKLVICILDEERFRMEKMSKEEIITYVLDSAKWRMCNIDNEVLLSEKMILVDVNSCDSSYVP